MPGTFVGRARGSLGALSTAILLAPPGLAAQGLSGIAVAVENLACQKCHAVPDLTVIDLRTNREVLLTVEPLAYAGSVHGRLLCVACHDYGYTSTLPHRGPVGTPRFLCVDCHRRRGDLAHLRLPVRRDDLQRGAHGRRAEVRFDCHTCHDPHRFRPVREEAVALLRIRASNRLCTSCHGRGAERMAGFEALADVATTHDLLPSAPAHFRRVKCVTCHVPADSATLHDVLPAEGSIGTCTDCHSRDSPVFERSYARPAGEEGAADGAAGGEGGADAARDNVYVIGSTRSAGLDRLSFIGLALLLAAIAVHGLARLFVARRGGGTSGGGH